MVDGAASADLAGGPAEVRRCVPSAASQEQRAQACEYGQDEKVDDDQAERSGATAATALTAFLNHSSSLAAVSRREAARRLYFGSSSPGQSRTAIDWLAVASNAPSSDQRNAVPWP